MTIWKYKLKVDDEQDVEMPAPAEILSVQFQGNSLCLWALVDPAGHQITRTIKIVGTGHTFLKHGHRYLASVMLGVFVFHVFEVLGKGCE